MRVLVLCSARGIPVDGPSGASAHLRGVARALDVFRDWDEDSSGSLSRKEFRKALSALGLGREYRDEVDGLFDSFDGDRSGSISYNELVRQLREHSPDAPPSAHRTRKRRAWSRSIRWSSVKSKFMGLGDPLAQCVRLWTKDKRAGRWCQAQ